MCDWGRVVRYKFGANAVLDKSGRGFSNRPA